MIAFIAYCGACNDKAPVKIDDEWPHGLRYRYEFHHRAGIPATGQCILSYRIVADACCVRMVVAAEQRRAC